jgi:hypothetical protein
MSVKIVGKKEMVVRDGLTEPLRWEDCRVIGKKKTIGYARNVG